MNQDYRSSGAQNYQQHSIFMPVMSVASADSWFIAKYKVRDLLKWPQYIGTTNLTNTLSVGLCVWKAPFTA